MNGNPESHFLTNFNLKLFPVFEKAIETCQKRAEPFANSFQLLDTPYVTKSMNVGNLFIQTHGSLWTTYIESLGDFWKIYYEIEEEIKKQKKLNWIKNNFAIV